MHIHVRIDGQRPIDVFELAGESCPIWKVDVDRLGWTLIDLGLPRLTRNGAPTKRVVNGNSRGEQPSVDFDGWQRAAARPHALKILDVSVDADRLARDVPASRRRKK